jgi:hypothetical protein
MVLATGDETLIIKRTIYTGKRGIEVAILGRFLNFSVCELPGVD